MAAQATSPTQDPRPAPDAVDVASDDAGAVRDMLRAFRRRHLEPAWEQLDRDDDARYRVLWQALAETGLAAGSLPDADGGIRLDAAAGFAALRELGAAAPALGVALVSHLAAQALLVDAGDGHWPASLDAAAAFALLASPLDAAPATGFTLERRGGTWRLDGSTRVMRPAGACAVLPARGTGGLMMCVLPAAAAGLSFTTTASSHGLCLLPFGELQAQDVALEDTQVFDWPSGGGTAQRADGLVTALIAGMIDELALRSADYARQRVQAGKPISEHHAVQHLLGSLELARRPVRALALATLASNATAGPAGTASAFALPLLRRGALDAIQVFGGYGYMQDYRVERYLRDANTLETFWVHAAQRERDLVTARCAALARGEAA